VRVDTLESAAGPVRRRSFGDLATDATARGLAIAAVGALLGAEVLPWISVQLTGSPDNGDGSAPSTADFSLALHAAQLPAGVVVAFQLGWSLLLAACAVALLGPDRLRRPLAAATAGLAFGQLALAAAVIGSSSDTRGVLALFGSGLANATSDELRTHRGAGMFCAGFAALLALLAAGLALVTAGQRPAAGALAPASAAGPAPAYPAAGATPAGSPPPEPDAGWQEEADVLDLTVTPLPPSGYQRP
jgi:hypothetical protein